MRTIKVSLRAGITYDTGMRIMSFLKMMLTDTEMDEDNRLVARIRDPREFMFFHLLNKAFGGFAFDDVSDDLGALDEETETDTEPDGMEGTA